MSVGVRDYRDTDSEQFIAIVRDLQEFEVALYDRMMPAEEIGDWYASALQARCKEEDGALLVAEKDGKLVGYATIFTNVEQRGEIDEVVFTYGEISHIAVSPESRGSGAGKLLMEECERRTRSAGRKWLRLNVLANNVSARSIYEHLGFRDHLITMEKQLD